MKTEYKYINFKLVRDTGKTTVWDIRNNSSDYLLGRVSWYSAWRQYCFLPNTETVFNKQCMFDILDFIGQLDEVRNSIRETK